MDKSDLAKAERDILTYVDRVGYTAPIVLSIRFRRSSKAISRSLERLAYGGFIQRPMKGLITSNKWMEENPEEKQRIEVQFNVQMAVAQMSHQYNKRNGKEL